MSPIRILIVDDQRLMREGLRMLLEMESDFEVVGEAADGQAAVDACARLTPDIVLMDIRMPGLDGVEATRRILQGNPSARVIILTTFDDDQYVFEGLRAGALGYLLKDLSGEELARAIRTVAQGGALVEPSVARKVFAEFALLKSRAHEAGQSGTPAEPLSEREIEVLRLIAAGMSNREIARQLFLAEGTVKNYVSSLLCKIGAHDRAQAAVRGRELGLI